MTGEGCFGVVVRKSSTKTGFRVQLKFKLTQHTRDAELLKSLVGLLGCGKYYPRNGYNLGDFCVISNDDLINKIIPFFDKYPIVGAKRQDYLNFKRITELMITKAHLTNEGLDQIRQIKAGMNRGRID